MLAGFDGDAVLRSRDVDPGPVYGEADDTEAPMLMLPIPR
jgi:hypothetical protein